MILTKSLHFLAKDGIRKTLQPNYSKNTTMRKLFLLIAVIVAMVCASCENLRVAHSVNGYTQIVCKDTKEGTLYAVGSDTPNGLKAETPVVFSGYAFALSGEHGGYFLYLQDKRSYYFFDSQGRDVLSGKKPENPDLEGLIPIINDGKDHRLTEEEMYYKHIVGFRHRDAYRNNYFIFPVEGDNVYAVVYNGDFAAMGPFKRVLFGLHGFMFQDPTTGKWGARTLANSVVEAEYRDVERDTPTIFAPEYDEIIEVEKTDKTSIWFARKGDIWYSKQVVTASQIKNVPVDQSLLNRVRKMKINSVAKSTKKNWVDILAHGQRFGFKEASVVHQ